MKKILIIYMMAISASLIVLTACNNTTSKEENAAKQAELTRVNDSLKLDSFNRVEAAKAVLQEEKKNSQSDLTRKTSNVSSSSNAQDEVVQPVSSQPTTKEKKGWSDAAKGTAIGAGVGAGVGALIDKDKRGRGAIIGAAIGGGSGYAIGRKKDRESGRVQKK